MAAGADYRRAHSRHHRGRQTTDASCLCAIAATRLREVFTAAALLLVIGIALAMEQVGLSPALGTFLAGVVLADSEFRHELESDIEPFKGLLLGLFFISVGASVDFDLLAANAPTIALLIGILVVIKFIVLLVVARLFRMPGSQGFLLSFALAQGGNSPSCSFPSRRSTRSSPRIRPIS